jgi:hypothetical protein
MMEENMRIPALFLIVLLASALSAGAVPQDVRLPDTDAGRIAADYFKVLNTGEEQDMLNFISAHMGETARKRRTDKERLEVFRDLRSRIGRANVHSVLKTGPAGIVVLTETTLAGWVSFDFVMEPAPSQKLDQIRIEQAEPPIG